MRKRTPSEIKAYGDGYIDAYEKFRHLLDRHDKDKAIRKMKIFADAVALTVETATGIAYTPQTEETCGRCVYVRGSQWCQGCNGTPKRWDGEKTADTPQTDCCDTCRHNKDGWDSEACDPCSRSNSNYEPQTDCGWK